MRKLMLGLILILLAVPAWSAPSVNCDGFCYPAGTQVDGFKIKINNGAWVDVAPIVQADGNINFLYDLAPLNLANGDHTGEVKGVNMWGESPTAPFTFKRSALAALTSIRLVKR